MCIRDRAKGALKLQRAMTQNWLVRHWQVGKFALPCRTCVACLLGRAAASGESSRAGNTRPTAKGTAPGRPLRKCPTEVAPL
eukprot:7168491-Prorocentrum_lima.AAC.1